ncbi:MAG: hypothetical protein KBD31_00025 [Proteobacteria bacterium]|nr:hypothetical protein [Pseudomonadota bacterium]
MRTYKLIENNIVLINQPKLIKEFGRSTAQFICHLHYWLEKGQGILKNDIRWIYNTAKEWGEQICLSSRQVERIISKLHNLNIIKVQHFGKTNRVNYITLNYEGLNALVNASYLDKMSESDRQNVGMHNKKTKITNKEINKSEERGGALQILQTTNNKNSSKQVEQVKKNDFKIEKIDSNSSEQPQKNNLQNSNKPFKANTAKEMVDLWNDYFPKSKTDLTKDLSKNLVAAFKLKFNSDMNLWKHYLKRIESSSYLTGESFQLSLYWALKFLTIDRIGKGDFGVKEVVIPQKTEDLKAKVEAHINSLNESDRLKDVRFKIAKVIGEQSYLSWFTQVSFFEDDKGFHLKANKPFVLDYVQNVYGYLFKNSLSS